MKRSFLWFLCLLLFASVGCGGDGGKGKHSDRDKPMPAEPSK